MFRQLLSAPNQLTLLRLCIIPFLVLAILDNHFLTAFILLVLAAISDGLDGLLARRFGMGTVLGQYLDPIADKLLLSTLFLVLTHVGLVPRRVTVLVLSRDVGILLIATLLFAIVGLRNFSPSIFGKMNTAAQILAVTSVLLEQIYNVAFVRFVAQGALYATMALTVISALHYILLTGQRLGATPGPGS